MHLFPSTHVSFVYRVSFLLIAVSTLDPASKGISREQSSNIFT